MYDLRRCFHPYDHQRCIFLCKLGFQIMNIIHIPDLLGKGCIDQYNIVIIQCFHSQIHNTLVLIVTDIFFKKVTASVIRLSSYYKDLF